ncbi:MAG TPA: C45 family peptidase [Gaiellaceae bacterium]|nr:C45 family peptidase [Gaiellaceae bacterium]
MNSGFVAQASYPRINAGGSARARGLAHGSQASERVRRSVELYRDVFAHYANWTWDEVKRHALAFTKPIAAVHPDYLEEMNGIAEGAGVAYEDILAINVRTEVMFSAVARAAAVECTSFAALPEATANAHVLVGQNWDWKPHTEETVIILDVKRDDGPDFVTVVEAGLLAKTGMNSAGIGLVTNALISDEDRGEPGLPYHVILRAILDAETLPQGLDAVTRHPRASAANYLIAHRTGQAVDVEAAPGDFSQVWLAFPEGGLLCHANHYISDTRGIKDVSRWYVPDSPFRLDRIQRLLDDRDDGVDSHAIEAALRDHASHPLGICKHGDPAVHEYEQSVTVASVIYDLTAGTMLLAEGRPCEQEYQLLDYSSWAQPTEQTVSTPTAG